MKIYFASYLTTPRILELDGDFGILTSYVEWQNKKKSNFPTQKPILFDSGAFSVFTGKANIAVEEYGEFLLKHKDKFDLYANLDVIGNAEATLNNQNYLESIGLKPLPTFHFGSDFSHLSEMIQKYSYIGLGGLVPYSKQKSILYSHLDKCFSIIKDKVKVHGWGMTGRETILRYPFYSVDSTSWLFGGIMRKKIKFNVVGSMRDSDHMAKAMEYHDLNLSNAKEIVRMVKTATQLWEKRGIKWQ